MWSHSRQWAAAFQAWSQASRQEKGIPMSVEAALGLYITGAFSSCGDLEKLTGLEFLTKMGESQGYFYTCLEKPSLPPKKQMMKVTQ